MCSEAVQRQQESWQSGQVCCRSVHFFCTKLCLASCSGQGLVGCATSHITHQPHHHFRSELPILFSPTCMCGFVSSSQCNMTFIFLSSNSSRSSVRSHSTSSFLVHPHINKWPVGSSFALVICTCSALAQPSVSLNHLRQFFSG